MGLSMLRLRVRSPSSAAMSQSASNPRQGFQNPIYIRWADVEVRRHADPALARRGGDHLALQIGDDHAAIDRRMAEADNARARNGSALDQSLVPAVPDSFVKAVGEGIDGGCGIFDAYFKKQFDGRAMAEAANGVERAALESARIRAKRHVARGVIGILGSVGPTELDRFDGIEHLLADKENAVAFRPEHPLMAVGRESVDRGGLDVDGKNAHPLNRVHKKEAIVAAAKERPISVRLDAVAAQVVDEADAEEARARDGFRYFVQRVVNREPGDLDLARRQTRSQG